MENQSKAQKALLSAAIAGILGAGMSISTTAAAEMGKPSNGQVKCDGGNMCSGKSGCHVDGKHGCAGQNTCKGQGWVMAGSEKECKGLQAKVTKASAGKKASAAKKANGDTHRKVHRRGKAEEETQD